MINYGDFTIDPDVTFLNHGSFGACPRPVIETQRRLIDELERQPVAFFVRSLEPRLERVRQVLGALFDADADDLALLPNASTGVSTVLRSLDLRPGDELLVTDHEYNACRNALDFVSERAGARVVVVTLPFPVREPTEIVAEIVRHVGEKTRLALIDHVTSPTGMVLPVEEISAALNAHSVDVLVDGAHAPGMVDLSLRRVGAAYYTGNCHKWLCAPKGAAFLHVRPDRQKQIVPLVVSHGYNAPSSDPRSRFRQLFDWLGTTDPTALLVLPDAIAYLEGLVDGGLPALRKRNHELAVAAANLLAGRLGLERHVPDQMIGSLVSFPLPPYLTNAPASALYADPLHNELVDTYAIEVPIVPWPSPPNRLIRVSAQIYNDLRQYDRLADALIDLAKKGKHGLAPLLEHAPA